MEPDRKKLNVAVKSIKDSEQVGLSIGCKLTGLLCVGLYNKNSDKNDKKALHFFDLDCWRN